ncbi:MAG TPA: TonB-dependent receptor [Candidatus Eremiobacteraceae bacterium]|nr:TonB-dependent receptor [Candidatus Eremiobacteraceae bacterium]
MIFRISLVAAFVAACVLTFAGPACAGTTGGLHGRVADTATGAPIVGAKVTASSPSQLEAVTTDANGVFVFISLAPDTYTITVSKDGYDIASLPGITVVADQSRNIGVTLQKTAKTLATISTRAATSLVRPGTTSDVYSINAATAKATSALGGSGSLNQAYGSVASAPGVVYQQGQQGWYQSIYIRGGDIDQTAYELDGIPTMRVSDSATVTTLSSLGQQEMQVYTGGTPASADASGIAGYVNQVIKTGTYPGFESLKLGIGGPALYNSAQFEAGSSTPDRRFNYYVGEALTAQGYRYGDQFNGASDPLFFMPAYIPSNNSSSFNGGCSVAPCVFDGSGTPLFSPGTSDAIASTHDYETVANFHYQLPHKDDPLHDDIQLLWVYSNLLQKFYTSLSDLGLSSLASQNLVEGVFDCGGGTPCTGPVTYLDQTTYSGPIFQAPNPNDLITSNFPNSGQFRPAFQDIPLNEREGSQNGAGIEKLQFQKNIDEKTYLRIFGYAENSWWWISGPVSANLTYGDQLPDYEVDGHTYGGDIIFSKQLSDKHLINATASYFTSKLETYSMGFQSGNFTSLIDSAGNCYDFTTGNLDSCYDGNSQGTAFSGLTPGLPPAGSPGALANAQWIVTENGQNAQIDTVHPFFSAASITDSWRPNEKLSFTLGIRMENFKYQLQDLATGYPARQFWFHSYNNEFCWGPGYPTTVSRFDPNTSSFVPCSSLGPFLAPVHLQNYHGGSISQTVPQPRFGVTDELNSDNVIRASYGRYARPAPTSYQEYNTFQQDLPSFLATFIPNGWNSPVHNLYSDTSLNADLSWEHHFPNTSLAMKVTPFLRTTQGQIQYSALNAQGVVAGVNAGKQVSDGVEFALDKGAFDRDGLSWALSATFTRSKIRYGPYPSGLSVIDLLNEQIQIYNSYTSACAGVAPSKNPQSLCGVNFNPNAQSPNALPVEPNGINNPYYNAKPQPLLDPNAQYTTYDEIPSPFSNAIGFETPFQVSVVLNWKSGPLTITPNFLYSTQGKYGSPLVWPGYDPQTCSGSGAANPQNCSGYIFIPDKYTGVFDNLGAFAQPQRLTANLSVGYEFNKHLTATLTAANLIDHCYQHNVPWANGPTCEYAQLQSNLLPAAGNFVKNPPIQLAYPYGSWYNNLEIAQMGQKNPVEAVIEFEYKP